MRFVKDMEIQKSAGTYGNQNYALKHTTYVWPSYVPQGLCFLENMILGRNVMYLIVYLVFALVKNVKIVTLETVGAVREVGMKISYFRKCIFKNGELISREGGPNHPY
mgnify:CR=1 FL=1